MSPSYDPPPSPSTRDEGIPRIDLFGIPVAQINLDGLLAYFAGSLRAEARPAPRTRLIAYANAHSCNLFLQDEEYRRALCAADLIYTDGNGPRLAAWMSGQWLPRRMTSADWYPALCALCAREGFRLYLLGAGPGVAAQAAQRLKCDFPDLQILGSRDGYFSATQEAAVLQEIHNAKPDLLILGMGSPRQEIWMARHRQALHVPVIWGAGGLLDYIAGTTRRAPRWMRKLALEWLGRMLIEPRRLAPRYLHDLPWFLFYTLRFALQRHARRLLH